MRVKRTSSFTKTLPPEQQSQPQISPKKEPLLLQSSVRSVTQTMNQTQNQIRSKQPSMTGALTNHGWTATKRPEIQESGLKQSKMGPALRTRLKSMANVFQHVRKCQICDDQIHRNKDSNDVFITKCEHKNNYCEPCLLRYVIYRVKINEEVTCPHQGCPAVMIENGDFFKNLPIDVQRNYRYTLQMFQKSKTKHLKLCPNDGCNGVLRPSYNKVLTCNTCSNAFCSECVLPVHDGHCNNYDPRFFQVAQRYQTCKWCKANVKKEEGNIHMICQKCRCEFCYVCGKKWTSFHERGHDQFGQVKVAALNVLLKSEDTEKNSSPLWIPLKIVLILALYPLFLVLYFLRDIMVFIMITVLSLTVGMLGFSFELLTRVDCMLRIVLIIFFPVTMIAGIGISFSQMFIPLIKQNSFTFYDDAIAVPKCIWKA